MWWSKFLFLSSHSQSSLHQWVAPRPWGTEVMVGTSIWKAGRPFSPQPVFSRWIWAIHCYQGQPSFLLCLCVHPDPHVGKKQFLEVHTGRNYREGLQKGQVPCAVFIKHELKLLVLFSRIQGAQWLRGYLQTVLAWRRWILTSNIISLSRTEIFFEKMGVH